MNDTDTELERRLRTWFRDGRDADVAPLSLRADVLAIASTSGASGASRRWRRSGLTLLAATAAIGMGAVGWSILAGKDQSVPPLPSPQAIVVAPIPSTQPAPTAQPASTAEPGEATGAPGPVDPGSVTSGLDAGWTDAGTLSEPRILATATLLQDGRVLVIGGVRNDGTAMASAEIWDPATRTFSPAGSLTRPRAGHAATRLHDGRVLVVGGEDGGESIPPMPAEVWDPATGAFEPQGEMLRLPSGLTATTLLDGRVLIVGREACTVERQLASKLRNFPQCPPGAGVAAWLWDPEDGSAVAGPPLNEERNWHTATLLADGRVLLVGNLQWGIDTPESAEVYDPSTNTFIRVDEPRDYIASAQTATLLRDGRVLVAGGDSGDPNGQDPRFDGPLAKAETWDPSTGRFARAGSMRVARRAAGTALLADGRVIVVGGSKASKGPVDPSTATTEIWDPAAGAFAAGPKLADARSRFALVTLPDGSVLVIGGDQRYDAQHLRGTGLATAELLDLTP
jgi:hypothetical protein